jgi:hydroxyacylglutathione hydrolase
VILRRLVLGAWKANCFIVGSDIAKKGLIIDPGDDPGEILDTVKKLGLKIEVLVATHGHIDHIGAIGTLKKATGAQVAIHSQDSTALQGDGRFFWGERFGPPMYADRLLEEGDTIEVADLHFEVINTPGHTYGGICLYGHGMLFTGDSLFYHSIGSTGIGTGSLSQLTDSILQKLFSLPEETVIHAGHGRDTTIGDEKKHNRYV